MDEIYLRTKAILLKNDPDMTPMSYTRDLLESIAKGPYKDSNLDNFLEMLQIQAGLALKMLDEDAPKYPIVDAIVSEYGWGVVMGACDAIRAGEAK